MLLTDMKHHLYFLTTVKIVYILFIARQNYCSSISDVETFLQNYNEHTARLKKISSEISWELKLGGLKTQAIKSAVLIQAKASTYMRLMDNQAEAMYNSSKELTNLPKDLKRQLTLITNVATPRNVEETKAINKVKALMEKLYTNTRVVKTINGKKRKLQLNTHLLPMFRKVSPERLNNMLWAWSVWRKVIGPKVKPHFIKLVELVNKGAQERGYADFGDFTRSGHEMAGEKFRNKTAQLNAQVAPLYKKLHAYVRFKLRQVVGGEMIKKNGMIQAHLLGMWPMKWQHLYNMMTPFPAKRLPDLTKKMKEKGIDKMAMVKMADKFFTAIGFDELPKTFWTKSIFKKKNKKMACQGSATDIGQGDVRMKMPCLGVAEGSLITLHHEMGHIQYYRSYRNQPFIYRFAANQGFQEAIGDVIALSLLVPSHLKDLGLLDRIHEDKEEDINYLMKQALGMIPMMPYAYSVELWRWSVFSKKTTPEKYNAHWWSLRNKYMGVKSPIARPEEEFDPGCFLHIDKNVEYIPYFTSQILQYTLHKALCQAAGINKPLFKCSICKSKAAGKKLKTMMELGRSKPWQGALEVLTGENDFNADALLEYYRPLEEWLDKHRNQNGYVLGWTLDNDKQNQSNN